VVLSLPAWAGEVPRVSVYGTAIKEVTPDDMFWSLKVMNRGPGIEKTAEQHAKILVSVLSFLGETGIAGDDIQTSMMQFGENWEHENGTRVQKGYFASSQVTFKLMEFAKYQYLWTGLSKIQGMGIQNIGYATSKFIEVQNQARIDALLAAREKAGVMAKTLNLALGDPLVIEEDQSFVEPRRSNLMMAGEAGFASGSQDTGGFALGKIQIKSNVRVVFRLITQTQ
jgi:hypothetical protein